MKLGDLLQDAGILDSYLPDDAAEILDITNDSRKVSAESLYIAIPGKQRDGHEFLEDVLKGGGRAAIVQKIDRRIPLAQYRTEDSRLTWSRLSAAFYGYPSRDLFVYGITATNGKTTISFMLDEILRAAGHRTGLIGTVKIKTGDEVIPAEMTTPESFALQGWVQMMKQTGVDTVTMEVSSQALEQKRTADIKMDVVSFNNFSREHIDQHGSLEAYWAAKSSLITDATENEIAVINLSDPAIKNLMGKSRASFVTYSTDSREGDVYPTQLNDDGGFPSFTLKVPRDIVLANRGITIPAQEFPVKLSVPGRHTVANAVACCAMALCQGIPGSVIAEGLRSFHGVERRFELLYEGDFRIIDDHFANTQNIDASLLSLSAMKYRRLHMVYCIRGNRGTTVNRENVQTLARWLPKLAMDEIIVTEARGDVAEHDLVHPEERAVFREEIGRTGLSVADFPRLNDALRYALKKAEAGDIILLAGTQGMDKAGRRILEFLSEEYPEQRDAIMSSVAGRVCG